MAEMDDKVIVTKDKITDIADTIRETGGTSSLMTLDEMPDNIRAIGEGGGNVVAPLFIKNGNNYTCNLTFAKIEEIYAGTGDTKASIPQLIYSGNDTRSIYCNVEQENEDAFSFDFNIGAIGITNTGYKEKHIVLIMESDNSIYFNREYTLEYQEDMIACKFSWDSRLNTYTCNKTYAQLKDMYVDNPDSSAKLPFLCTRYGQKSNTCQVQYVEQGHLILFLFFMESPPEHIIDSQQLDYMQMIVYENGTITGGQVTKGFSKHFEPYNGIEFAQGTAPSPYLQLTENVRNSIATSLMIGESNGSVASFSDGGANMPLKSCMVAIEPVQSGSGDPSPSNVRTISGWTECNVTRDGKNLYSNKWSDYTRPADYRICPVKLEIGKTYTLSCRKINTVTGCVVAFAKKGDRYSEFGTFDTIINNSGDVSNYIPKTFTVDATYTSPKLAIYCSDEETFNSIFENYEIMLEESPSATTYEPYQGNTYNIEFPSQAGTVYGGTLDVVSGVLTVTYILIDMGTLTWGTSGATYLATSGIDSAISTVADIGQGFICSHYPPSTNWSLPDDKTMAIWTTQVKVKDTDYATPEAFKTAMNGVKLCYEVRVPQTYQLTPIEIKTLLGINNIFADTGDVLNAEYTRDASIIINEILERVIALEQGA